MKTSQALFDIGPPPRCPENFNITEYVLAAARKTPEKTALEVISDLDQPSEKFRFVDLDNAIRATMTGLTEAGITVGDRVFLRLKNSANFPILFFATSGIGALPIPISPMLTDFEVQNLISDVQPKAMCVSDGFSSLTGTNTLTESELKSFADCLPRDAAKTKSDDPAYLIFTSGTGGKSKAVLHAHRAVFARRMMWRDWYDLRPDDRVLHAGAFNWSFTLGTGIMDPWAIGATAMIYTGKPDKGIWAEIASSYKPTLFAAAPGVYRQLLSSGKVTKQAFSSLRHGLSAGDRLPDLVRKKWHALTGKKIYSALGMSEISTYISQSPNASEHPTPQSGRKVCILKRDTDEIASFGATGRLAVSKSDPGLMLGYWSGPDDCNLPLMDDWFITGDFARMQEDGSILHEGRADDLLNAQGYRVSAFEVENVINNHPDVDAAAVIALEVRKSVEIVAAFVESRKELSAEVLKSYCREYLADYKLPRQFTVLQSLPRTATGKVLKRELKRIYGWKGEE